MKSKVHETSNKVFVENIPKLEWGKNRDNSFIRSAQLALNALGEDYTYDYLMGLSGAAFRLHYNLDWCPSAADFTTGFDVSNVLFKSLGYACELHKIDDNNFDDIRSLYQKIIAHINSGVPIVAINLKVCPEWGIITGYLKNKPGILCRTYFDETEDYSLAEHAPWLSFFIGNKGKPYDENRIFGNALKIAVKLSKTDGFADYKSGFSAFEHWIRALKKHYISTRKKRFDEYEVNLTILYSLIDARQAAVKYLMSMSHKMKKGPLIIDHYIKEVELLKDAQKNILPSFDSKPDAWTSAVIEDQIDVLKQALLLEKEVIGFIEDELKI